MSKPFIGITPDRNEVVENIEAEYFVRRNYCAAVADSGAIPLILPYQSALVEAYLDRIDGLLLTGGMFDIDPAAYGMAPRHPGKMALKDDRTRFERALLRGALARNMPVLGICGGMQLIAVELGASLHQHLPSDLDSPTEHKQAAPCDSDSHAITLTPGSQLRRILGVERCRVNSLHHQAVIEGNERLRVGARADDGVVEAIEATGHPFCVGVQWHPEYGVDPRERRLFAALFDAAQLARARARTVAPAAGGVAS